MAASRKNIDSHQLTNSVTENYAKKLGLYNNTYLIKPFPMQCYVKAQFQKKNHT